MRIVVDRKNRVCFGIGHAYGKRIKAVVRLHENDSWDEEKGKEFLKKKFKIKEAMAKRDMHKKEALYSKKMIEWHTKLMDYENEIVSRLNDKISRMQEDYKNITK